MANLYSELKLSGALRGEFTSSANLPIDETDLIAWWKMEASPWGDATGNVGDPDSENGSPAAITGKVNGAIDLSAASTSLEYNDATWMDRPNDAFTVGFWCKHTSIATNAGVIGKGSPAGSNLEWEMQRFTTLSRWRFSVDGTTAVTMDISSLSADVWYFYVFRWDSSLGSDQYSFWRGAGASLGSPATRTNASSIHKGSDVLYIGDNDGLVPDTVIIDELFMFDRALSDDEISTLFNGGDGVTYG